MSFWTRVHSIVSRHCDPIEPKAEKREKDGVVQVQSRSKQLAREGRIL